MRWKNKWTLVKQWEPAISLHVSDYAGYQRWRGDILLWHSACAPAWTHTHLKHAHTEPTNPHSHGPTHACSYVQMYPKSVWNVSDTSYLATDNDTHQLWTVSFRSGTFLPPLNQSHLHFRKKKKKSFAGHFPWQMHILLWLVLRSGWFILVARRNAHMVDMLCRPYQQNQTWNLGQGCTVMTKFIFLCPHMFSLWPCSNFASFLHKPQGDSRKPRCMFGSTYAAWSTVAHLITTCVSGLTLIQQVMLLGGDVADEKTNTIKM